MPRASDAFFDVVRYYAGSLDQGQVDGLNSILIAWDGCASRFCGYALATAALETAYTMQPIEEYGSDQYFHDMYDPEGNRPEVAADLGNIYPGDGVLFHGRGYVMLTGRSNYEKASSALEHDFVTFPDDALDPDHAAAIMVRGMCEGWFTGKKLSDYFNRTVDDPFNARRIINGTDRAETIAGYHKHFCEALQSTSCVSLYP